MRFMPTCKDVHRLVSEELDRPLSLVERVRVRMHLIICGPCSNFDAQMHLIQKAMRRLDVPEPGEEKNGPK